MRSLKLPGASSPSLLAFAPQQGLLVAHSQANLSLHSFTVNGRHRLTCECTERVATLAVSPDGKFMLTGGAKGVITLMWLHSFQVGVPCLLRSVCLCKKWFLKSGVRYKLSCQSLI